MIQSNSVSLLGRVTVREREREGEQRQPLFSTESSWLAPVDLNENTKQSFNPIFPSYVGC